MFALVQPHPRYHHSFLGAVDEFLSEGDETHAGLVDWPADETFPGRLFTREALAAPEVFEEFTRFLSDDRLPESPRPRHFVPATVLWMTDEDEYLGRISLRHELNHILHEIGGHIGYSVRPSARRRGYATRALAEVLPIAADLGIDPVLVTCDVDNVASRRTIENNGGVLEDVRTGKLRFWVPTGSAFGRPHLLGHEQPVTDG